MCCALASPDILASLSAQHMLGLLAVRVAAERCFDTHHWLRFDVALANGQTDSVTLELRRGVLQIHPQIVPMPPEAPVLALNKASLMVLLSKGAAAFPELMAQGALKITQGSPAGIAALFACFEPRATVLPKLASR
jgi:alkyl sulfatase BDS1-like metallo-beta-lactamase superfamily hydrolase